MRTLPHPRAAALAFFALAVLATISPAGEARPAQAAPSVRPLQTTEHRAVVVVETGSLVRHICVRFQEPSISGIEALRRAGVSPVVRTYGGQGTAVCSLCGQGCPADGSCLTCGGSDYWGYFRAPSGAATFSYARGGAGATQVRDGDVEGWRWGRGDAPAYVTVDRICGPVLATVPSTITAQGTADQPSEPRTAPVDVPTETPTEDARPSEPSVQGTAVERAADTSEQAATGPERARPAGSPFLLLLVGAATAMIVGALVIWGSRRVGTGR